MTTIPTKPTKPTIPTGTGPTSPIPDFFSILGEPIQLQFDSVNAREKFGFVPVDILVSTPFCDDFSVVGKEYNLGIWSITTTNLGVMYVVSIDGKLYKILVSHKKAEASCITAYDEAACITVFDGRRAIAQAIRYRDGKVTFRNNKGGEVRLDYDGKFNVTPELARLFPSDVLILFDQNLHTGLNNLVAPEDDPTAIIIPILVACCNKANVYYDSDGGWGGSVGWDCNCSIF